MTPGVCQYCECRDDAPCATGCSWADETRVVCSTCELGRLLSAVVLRALAHVHPAANLWVDAFAERPPDEQQLLVMAGRSLIEVIHTHATDDLDVLREQVNELLDELRARDPDLIARAQAEKVLTLRELVMAAFEGKRTIILAR
jgi:hypothetical protein